MSYNKTNILNRGVKKRLEWAGRVRRTDGSLEVSRPEIHQLCNANKCAGKSNIFASHVLFFSPLADHIVPDDVFLNRKLSCFCTRPPNTTHPAGFVFFAVST